MSSANNAAEWSGIGCDSPLQIVQCNGCLAEYFQIWRTSNGHYYLQRAFTPDPASSNFKKVRQTAITIFKGLPHPGQHCPLRTYQGFFFKGRETSEDINSRLLLMNKKGFHRNPPSSYRKWTVGLYSLKIPVTQQEETSANMWIICGGPCSMSARYLLLI